jgi:hypothetical protein
MMFFAGFVSGMVVLWAIDMARRIKAVKPIIVNNAMNDVYVNMPEAGVIQVRSIGNNEIQFQRVVITPIKSDTLQMYASFTVTKD